MNVVVLGDSHAVPLARALDARRRAGRVWSGGTRVTVRPLGPGLAFRTHFFRATGDGVELTDERYRAVCERLPIPRFEDATYCFLGPLYGGRLSNTQWDHYALASENDPVRAPISEGVFRAMVRADQRYVPPFLRALQQRRMPVVVAESPWLFADSRYVNWVGKRRALLYERRYRAIVAADLEQLGVAAIRIPAETVDDEGFTRAVYVSDRAEDRVHGNVALGELMLSHIVGRLAVTDDEAA